MQKLLLNLQPLLPTKKLQLLPPDDKLLHSTAPYYILSAVLVLAYVADLSAGYLFIFFTYALLPLCDQFLTLDYRNPSQDERKELERRDFEFKVPVYLSMVVDWMLFFKAMRIFSTTTLTTSNIVEFMAYVFAYSNLTSIQAGSAHEIFHKQNPIDKFLGTFHLIKNLYLHLSYEHVYGHHRRVATPQDPASAQKNTTLYQFILKTYFGSYKSVYQMQKELKKPIYLNLAVLSVIACLAFTVVIFGVYGVQGGVFFVVQAYGSIFFVEAINYIQHYGLRRKKMSDGSYQRITLRHSWNAPHRLSNYLFFKIQRHSDHHQNSLKPYQTLIAVEHSPQFPHGYSVCVFMSFFPALWFRVMNPLVDAYAAAGENGDIDEELKEVKVREARMFILGMCGVVGVVVGGCLVIF